MNVLLSMLALAQMVQTIAQSPPESLRAKPVDVSQLSLVIATSGKHSDRQPLCVRDNCTSLYLVHFSKAKTVAGRPQPIKFAARMELGSPLNQPYRLVLVIENRPGREPLIRASRGFHYQTGVACFSDGELRGIDWKPQGGGISYQNGNLCVAP